MGKRIEVTMDAYGRVCIPKEIRKTLGLSPGKRVVIEANGSDEIRLRPTTTESSLPEKNLSLVVLKDADGNEAEDMITQEREDRMREIAEEFSS